MTNDGSTRGASVPLENATCRFSASFFTWPVEKSKLIFQAEGVPVFSRLFAIPLRSHLQGALASCTQRGSSAFLMFYLQHEINIITNNVTPYKALDEGLAGVLAGLVSGPFHTYWELMKVRIGQPVTIPVYRAALAPMMLRHGVFDGSFFFVNEILSEYSSAVRFSSAAAAASFCNLVFDVWKTQRMHRFPQPTSFWFVVSSMRMSSFLSNYAIKGLDLSFNWFMVGLIKDCFM
mmetsp:Transcript_23468/g.34634  ORF Transcript_23468/g.34634 Transcript_23468/m.34634 type:complete len:234 (-) Transcript_23468:314-1015(-)